MRKIKNIMVATSLLCFLFVAGLLADDDMKHHQTVTFDKPTLVDKTTLKEGTYRVTFDVSKSEVKFAKDSNGNVVLVAHAMIENMSEKAEQDSAATTESSGGTTLKKLVFKGHTEAAVFGTEGVASSVSNN